MKTQSQIFIISIVMILFISFTSKAQHTVDYDKSIDFSRYKTFLFKTGITIIDGKKQKNQSLDDEIKEDIIAKLEAKGLVYSESNPDIVITYVAGATTETELVNMGPWPYGPTYWGNGFSGSTEGWWSNSWDQWWERSYKEGTLVLDIIDTNSNRLAWRSLSKEVLKKSKSQPKQVDKMITKALKDYPPMKRN